MRFATLSVAAVALTLGMAGAAVAQDTERYIVVSHGQSNDPFWSVVKNGVDAAAADLGVEVEWRNPATFDVVEMARLIENAVASDPDGLIVTIPDADAVGPAIRTAIDAGIPVVSMNSGSDVFRDLGVSAHVGQTEYEAGLGAGQQMKAAGVTNAVCVNHEVGNVALDLRCEGFEEGLGGVPVEVLATPSNEPTEIKAAVSAKLAQDPTVDAILAVGTMSGPPILEAVTEAGLDGKVHVGMFDLSETGLQAALDGRMDFLVDQQQYLQGYLPVVMLHNFHKWGTMPSGVVQTGPGFVTKDNAAAVIDWSKQGYR